MKHKTSQRVRIDYTSANGERSWRSVAPVCILFGYAEGHREPQWQMQALDLETSKQTYFTMASIHAWEPLVE